MGVESGVVPAPGGAARRDGGADRAVGVDAEATRDVEATRRVAAERLRIARDLHDVAATTPFQKAAVTTF